MGIKRTTKSNKARKLNVTVAFCEDEEANQIAFESAVRAILFKGDSKISKRS